MLKKVSEMTTEELKEHLRKLREKRKTGYSPKPRKRNDGMFGDIPPELAAKILAELKKS